MHHCLFKVMCIKPLILKRMKETDMYLESFEVMCHLPTWKVCAQNGGLWTPVIASIYTSGRDEKNFSQADKFLPYRWDRSDPRRKDLENHIPSASLPFALGARSCIGKKLAMLQITELVYQIVNNFDIKCLNENEIKPITCQVLVASENIKIAVTQRKL